MVNRWQLIVPMNIISGLLGGALAWFLLGEEFALVGAVLGTTAMMGPSRHLSEHGFFWESIVHWFVCFAPGMLTAVVVSKLTASSWPNIIFAALVTSALVGFQELFDPARNNQRKRVSESVRQP